MRQGRGQPAAGLPIRQCGQGFTLVELMVALAIAAILMTVAVPSMQDAALNGKLRAQSNAFLASLHLARSEAIKRNGRVVLCKSSDGVDCAVSGGWEQGWIVFSDNNNDANRAGDTDEVIVERHEPLASGFLLRGGASVASYISFNPAGSTMSTSGALQFGSVTLCRSQPMSDQGKQIVLNAAGRARVCETNPLTACPPSSLAENCRS
jgi:type IV fimbrial biogenesis protein FimT